MIFLAIFQRLWKSSQRSGTIIQPGAFNNSTSSWSVYYSLTQQELNPVPWLSSTWSRIWSSLIFCCPRFVCMHRPSSPTRQVWRHFLSSFHSIDLLSLFPDYYATMSLSAEQQLAFDTLKDRLSSPPSCMSLHSDWSKPFLLLTSATNFTKMIAAILAILGQTRARRLLYAIAAR
jgi:hypothetical protein